MGTRAEKPGEGQGHQGGHAWNSGGSKVSFCDAKLCTVQIKMRGEERRGRKT